MKFHFEGLDVPITLPDRYLTVRMYENLQVFATSPLWGFEPSTQRGLESRYFSDPARTPPEVPIPRGHRLSVPSVLLPQRILAANRASDNNPEALSTLQVSRRL